MTKQELKAYLVVEVEFSQTSVDNMSSYSLVDEWLKYEGIIGYTNQIKEVFEAAYGIKLNAKA